MPGIRDLRSDAIRTLAISGIPTPYYEIDLILTKILGTDRAYLHTHPEEQVPEEQISIFKDMIRRRAAREPLQYLLGSVSFYGYQIKVGTGVLIPRPETEILVQEALNHFEKGTFLDWGTGTACISIALLSETEDSRAIAIERNSRAIRWAWRNLADHRLFNRVLLLHLDGLQPLPVEDNSLDLMVSNPPYIKSADLTDLMDEVRSHEPSIALDGGFAGTDMYPPILELAGKKLKRGAYLIVECGGDNQAEYLSSLSVNGMVHVFTRADLSGEPRVVGWRRV